MSTSPRPKCWKGYCTRIFDAATATHMARIAGMRREKDGCGSTEILAGIFLSWVMEPAKKADECRPFLSNCKAVGLSGSFSLLLCDLALEQAGALRKFLIVGFDEEGIEATAMF
ncbi:conserved hypothetical protein, partial [Brucella melitensis bv. 1 str. 16M]